MRFVSPIFSAVLGISLVAATIGLAADAESLPGKRVQEHACRPAMPARSPTV